jgi:hypothetical protein
VKILKRIIGVFFIISTLASVSLFSVACDNQTPNPEITIIAEVDKSDKVKEEKPKEEKKEEIKTYISSLSVPEIIYLSNNGIGIDFVVDFEPTTTTEEILIEIENEEIINFGSEISEEDRESLVNFTTDGNILYPLSVGQTLITVTAKASENEIIRKTCLIVVKNYEFEMDFQLLNTKFMSGQKVDGEYEIYSARIASLNPIQNKNFNIIKSDCIQIKEESLVYNEENGFYYLSFDFYLTEEGNHSLGFSIENHCLNLSAEFLYSENIEFSSTDFIKEIDVNVKREDNQNILKEDSKFLLYLIENEELREEADLEGLLNNYIIELNIPLEKLSITADNNSIVSIVETDGRYKIVANEIGEAEILISATDGSGRSVKLDIKVSEVSPSQLKIGEIDLLSEYSQENLDKAFENIEIVLGENDSKTELSILISKYVKDSYIYFSSEDENLTISSAEGLQNDSVLKTFTFTSEVVGEYNIDLIVNNVVIYSFFITVKPYPYEFGFSEVEIPNVEYDFKNRKITVSSFIPNNSEISFDCFIYYNNKEKRKTIYLTYDNEVFEGEHSLGNIYLRIKQSGSFTLIITDLISNLSTSFTIIVNE